MKRSKVVTLGTVPLLAAVVAGCGDDEVAYCTTQDGQVVENRYCDNDGLGNDGFFWFFTGSSNGYHRGQVIDRSKGERIASTNRSALSDHGGLGKSARAGGVGRATGGTRGGFGGGFGKGGGG